MYNCVYILLYYIILYYIILYYIILYYIILYYIILYYIIYIILYYIMFDDFTFVFLRKTVLDKKLEEILSGMPLALF